jgi:hypothetical protein
MLETQSNRGNTGCNMTFPGYLLQYTRYSLLQFGNIILEPAAPTVYVT